MQNKESKPKNTEPKTAKPALIKMYRESDNKTANVHPEESKSYYKNGYKISR